MSDFYGIQDDFEREAHKALQAAFDLGVKLGEERARLRAPGAAEALNVAADRLLKHADMMVKDTQQEWSMLRAAAMVRGYANG